MKKNNILLLFMVIMNILLIPIYSQTRPLPTMVKITGGLFSMGSDSKNAQENEKPVHKVEITSFSISKYLVTAGEYKAFCISTSYTMPEKTKGEWINNEPICNISWYEATAYCNWINELTGKKYRLPTEAEWEYAARGGNKSQGYIYAGSNNIDEVGWCLQPKLANEVGKKKPNEIGLYDMCGYVAQWCSDWYNDKYYSQSSIKNPLGPTSGKNKVARGGSRYFQEDLSRLTFRWECMPSVKRMVNGFRLASDK